MTFRAVFFDVGSVLVQDMDSSYREAWTKRLGLEPQTLTELLFESEVAAQATVGAASYEAVWAHVGARLKLSPTDLAELKRDFWRGDQVDVQLLTFLRSLRPRYITALLSNAWPHARQAFTELGLADAVDTMIISAEVGLCKPDPRIYHLALERVGVTAEEAIFLDDVEENVLAAREVGLCAIHYQTTPQAIMEIRRRLALPEENLTFSQ